MPLSTPNFKKQFADKDRPAVGECQGLLGIDLEVGIVTHNAAKERYPVLGDWSSTVFIVAHTN